jgi:hypothetical protein
MELRERIIEWIFKISSSRLLLLLLLPSSVVIADHTLPFSACEIDDVLIEVIQLKPRSRMKKLMRQSAAADASTDLSMSGSVMDQQAAAAALALATASSISGEPPNALERTESALGENIKCEFKKALASRRPSST